MVRIRRWKFKGIYSDGNRLFTENLTPSQRVYGEELVSYSGKELRVWDPKRSKACAMLKKGSRFFPLTEYSRVLYLGAANGTTASHLSDIASRGMIFCIEFSQRAFYDLVEVCKKRPNMIPVLADATKPDMYKSIVGGVDVVYQDVSQRDQVGIFLLNLNNFLDTKGYGILMVKARSVDVTAKPQRIFMEVEEELRRNSFELLESIPLKPYEKDHAAIVVKRIIS